MVEDYFRRVKVTAHHLGLGLPDDLYSESRLRRFCRGRGRGAPTEASSRRRALGSDPDGSSSLDSNRIAEPGDDGLRGTPLLGGAPPACLSLLRAHADEGGVASRGQRGMPQGRGEAG